MLYLFFSCRLSSDLLAFANDGMLDAEKTFEYFKYPNDGDLILSLLIKLIGKYHLYNGDIGFEVASLLFSVLLSFTTLSEEKYGLFIYLFLYN